MYSISITSISYQLHYECILHRLCNFINLKISTPQGDLNEELEMTPELRQRYEEYSSVSNEREVNLLRGSGEAFCVLFFSVSLLYREILKIFWQLSFDFS